MFLLVGCRHEHVDVPADHLGFGIAKQLFAGRVHRLDQATLVDRDDRIDSRCQNGSRSRFAVLKLADRLSQVGDVAGDAGEHAGVASGAVR